MFRIALVGLMVLLSVSIASAQKPGCSSKGGGGGQSSMRGSPMQSQQMTGYRPMQSNSMQSSMMATQLATQQRSQLQTAQMVLNAGANGFQNALRAEAAWKKQQQLNAELRGNR
jgi:hypothetical protein